jgi:osmotically inducible protein OsmC
MAYDVMYTANATVTGEGRKGTGRTDDRRLEVDLSVPKGMGGDDGPGTNPEQLFAVGYGACFHGALKAVARKEKIDVGDSTIDAQVSLGKDDDGMALAVALTVTIPGVDQAKAEELVEGAHQMCPYSRATRGNIEVTLTAKTA